MKSLSKVAKVDVDWLCPNCGDLIEDEDDRIQHLVVRHNTSINLVKLAQILKEKPE